jgi:hypothetical protein
MRRSFILPGSRHSLLSSFARTVSIARTGADLKAVIEDGKLAYAHDRVSENAARAVESYFLEAIEGVREKRQRYRRKFGF